MTLGERICAQRTGRGLSQADLAERLEVSRQSISKWETDASVPELDKLVKLCELFDMTLDQLVRGEVQEETEEAAEETPPAARPSPEKTVTMRMVLGIILLFFGCLIVLLLTLWGGPLEGLALASPFLLCGAVCLVARRHTGLLCGWIWWGLLSWYLRYATGIRLQWIFSPLIYQPGMGIHALIAWGIALTFGVLAAATLYSVWKWNQRKRENEQ